MSATPGTAARDARRLFVCFDYEGGYGMPTGAAYDLHAATDRILETLAAHAARGVFFVVGRLVVEHPELVRSIDEGGHELALHGWRHENLAELDAHGLRELDAGLREAEDTLERVTGHPPAGFRAPYLLTPCCYRPEVHALLHDHGYRWTSNRELRQIASLVDPARLRPRMWNALERREAVQRHPLARALHGAYNVRPLRRDSAFGATAEAVRWLADGTPPFFRGELLELPVCGPLDCHLVGLPGPETESPAATMRFARYAIRDTLASAGRFTMLTFHDWIITGANRLTLLDDALSAATSAGIVTTTVDAAWAELVGATGATAAAAATGATPLPGAA